jgi:hypothetical protein
MRGRISGGGIIKGEGLTDILNGMFGTIGFPTIVIISAVAALAHLLDNIARNTKIAAGHRAIRGRSKVRKGGLPCPNSSRNFSVRLTSPGIQHSNRR